MAFVSDFVATVAMQMPTNLTFSQRGKKAWRMYTIPLELTSYYINIGLYCIICIWLYIIVTIDIYTTHTHTYKGKHTFTFRALDDTLIQNDLQKNMCQKKSNIILVQ